MKKTYLKPAVQVMAIQTCKMLSGSNPYHSVRAVSSSNDGFSLKDDGFDDSDFDR